MSKPIESKMKLPFGTFFLVTIIVGLWSLVTPLFEFPDEQVHLETVEYVAEHGNMPAWGVPDTTPEMTSVQTLLGTYRDQYGNNKYTYHPDYHVEYTATEMGKYEAEIHALNTPENRNQYVKDEGALYPPLYYVYSSLWLRLVSQADLITRSYLVRLGNLPLVFFMALFTYLLGLRLFQKPSYARTLMYLTMLQPMFSFLSAGTNSDNLHNLLFFVVTYYGVTLIQNGLALRPTMTAILAVVLDIYTKPQGFIAAGALSLAIIIAIGKTKQWKLLFVLMIGGLATALIALPQLREYLSFALITNFRGLSFWEYFRFSANKLIAQNVVWYWGVFKWLGVVLPPPYWQVANRVILLSTFGFAIYLWRVIRRKRVVAVPSATLYVFCVALLYAGAIFWADWQHHKNVGYSIGIQARYFFPTLVAHLSLLMTGILSFGWSGRVRLWLRRGLIILFTWLQLGGLWRLLTAYYDTDTLSHFVIEVSQYKPWFVKGSYVYVELALYTLALSFLFYTVWRRGRVKRV